MELDEGSPPVKDDRKQLEDRDTTCGLLCGSSNAVPDAMDQGPWDTVDGPVLHRVKKTIYWVSVMDGLQRVLIFADDEGLSCLARKVGFHGVEGELGWCSGESACLPPLCLGFDSRTWGPFLESPGNYRAWEAVLRLLC